MQPSVNQEPNIPANKIPDNISEQLEKLCIKPLTEIEKLELKQWEELIKKEKNNIN